MSDKWNLEPIDMLLHALVAAAFVALGALGAFVHMAWLVWPLLLIAVIVFYIREGLQQRKKANPPKQWWNITQWGPRGIAEFVVVIPAVFLVAIAVHIWLG